MKSLLDTDFDMKTIGYIMRGLTFFDFPLFFAQNKRLLFSILFLLHFDSLSIQFTYFIESQALMSNEIAKNQFDSGLPSW